MSRLTEFLLIYDLPLLAAANEQRGSAWISERTGVDVEGGGVLSRDDLIALRNFEQADGAALRQIWAERDQQALLDLAQRLKSAQGFAPPQPDSPAAGRGPGSLALTILMLALALLAAVALVQIVGASDSPLHATALLIYGGAVVLLVLGWRLGRYLWRTMRSAADTSSRGESGG